MPQFIYTMKGLGKIYPPDSQVLKDIWLSFLPGAKIGVLGLNGSGKSTLLKIMAGVDHDFVGEAFPAEGITVGYLSQEPKLDDTKTVLGIVEEGVSEVRALLQRFDEINDKFAQDLSPEEMEKVLEEQARVQDKIEAAGAWELDSKLELAMDALRLPPPDVEVKTLSGGERRRVALCRLLLRAPDLLLLDEPTNHLDAESVAWLERFLKDYPGTVVAVTHDRYFLDNVAGWILELDRGSGIPWEGNYSSWLEQKQKRLQLEEKSESKRQRSLARELEWVRMAPRARQAKGKARLRAYEELLGQDTAKQIDTVEIYIQPGPRLGDVVVLQAIRSWIETVQPAVSVDHAPGEDVPQLRIAEHQIEIGLRVIGHLPVALHNVGRRHPVVHVELSDEQFVAHGHDLIDETPPRAFGLPHNVGNAQRLEQSDVRLDAESVDRRAPFAKAFQQLENAPHVGFVLAVALPTHVVVVNELRARCFGAGSVKHQVESGFVSQSLGHDRITDLARLRLHGLIDDVIRIDLRAVAAADGLYVLP